MVLSLEPGNKSVNMTANFQSNHNVYADDNITYCYRDDATQITDNR